MASPRLRNLKQRLALWTTALLTFGAGAGVYVATDQQAASKSALAFRLEEMTPEKTGIRFVHEKGEFSPFFKNVWPFLQAHSAAACVCDVDRDGLLDVFVLTAGRGAKNKLYRNLGNFRFAEASLPMIEDLNNDGFSTDCLFADIDNDGFDDLLVMAMSHRPWLFLNVPAPGTPLGRSFKDVSQTAGLPDYLNGFTAAFFDIDNDGDLDLLLAGYYAERYDPEDVPGAPLLHHLRVPDHEGAGHIFPNNLGNANNGGRKYLLINDGAGHFEGQDLAKWGLLTTPRWAWDIGTGDLNGDGFTDVYIANDFGPDELYLNRAGRSFQSVVGRYPTDVGRDSFKGMNAEIADINHDGYPEIYVTNIFHPFLPEGNMLWSNQPDPSGDRFMRRFTNLAAPLGVNDGGWAWGAKFVDLDGDGEEDLVVTNGFISHDPKKDYWYRMTRIAGGSGKIISNSKTYPPFGDMSVCGYQRTRVFVHEGSRYYDRAEDAGMPASVVDGRGVLLADFDLDGRMDILITKQAGAPYIARNRYAPNHSMPEPPAFLGLQVVGDGRRVNADAVGTRVKITPARPEAPHAFATQYREVNCGNGFEAQSMYWLLPALGRYRGPVDVEIRWADGRLDTFRGLDPNRYYRLRYGVSPEPTPQPMAAAAP